MKTLATLLLCALSFSALAHTKTTPASPVHITDQGTLQYTPYPNGDRVPDYSFAGYRASEVPLPHVEAKVVVAPTAGDQTARIQAAIDYVATLKPDAEGFRGAVLLQPGQYLVEGTLWIRHSGIVLRGSGREATKLVAAGNADKGSLIKIMGGGNQLIGDYAPITDDYVPLNGTTLHFAAHTFNIGDAVIVRRPSPAEWIASVGGDRIGHQMEYNFVKWLPDNFDILWERKVVAVTPTSITLDVPLTNSLDAKFGGGQVAKYTWDDRIRNVGVENLTAESRYDAANPKDENHRWMAITIDNAEDCWVQRLDARHFASSAVAVWESARRVTVQDCRNFAPVAEIAAHRRLAFQTMGQQTLFQRCYAEYGWHDFSVGWTAPGPNVFVQVTSYMPHNFSGTTGGWSSGVLFDKATIIGGSLSMTYRDMSAQGAGWTTAGSMLWQPRAGQTHVSTPPGAHNWVYGSWSQPYGDAHYEVSHTFLKPESLFYAQLQARTGKPSPEADKIYVYPSSEMTNPTPEYAHRMSLQSLIPDMVMDAWIDTIALRYPISTARGKAKNLEQLPQRPMILVAKLPAPRLEVRDGKIVRGENLISGTQNASSMWRGTTKPADLRRPAPNLNRFVPGRTGRGRTDDLDTLARDMVGRHSAVMRHSPALWHERRRDDHERAIRSDADVWAPFMEQPFSRSGRGEAADRMSKYDLDQFNPYYWARLKRFADLADEQGLVLWHEHYLQHNIIEEGAHWVDYPWRVNNNINDLGFVEPTRFAGDKRVYMAEQFYNLGNEKLVGYHTRYQTHATTTFASNNGVIHCIAGEYTGPAEFMAFWLRNVAPNAATHLVSVNGTKDVLDATLENPATNALFQVIDIAKWQYNADGTLWAPEGGVSLALRQYQRLDAPGEVSFASVYRAVNEYRTKYPAKAVVYTMPAQGIAQWAVLLAGGSLARIPHVDDAAFLKDAAQMVALPAASGQWAMGKPGVGYLIYNEAGAADLAALRMDRMAYRTRYIDARTGALSDTPPAGAYLTWLSR